MHPVSSSLESEISRDFKFDENFIGSPDKYIQALLGSKN